MIRRVIASFSLLICLYFTALANKELSIKLDNKDRVQSERLGFAYVSFEYFDVSGNNALVRVSIENITSNPPHAVLMFKNDMMEQSLKKGKPKIEFEKTYPGKKGTRLVRGCRESYQNIDIIPAVETDTVFTIYVPFTSSKDFMLSLYEAKYKPKKLSKKGKNNINYKILEEHLYDIHIEVVGWSEEDPTYINAKNSVDDFLSSLKGVEFCNNKRHSPTLREQQRPYQEKKDSLVNVINNILENSEWMSTDAPHKAYTRLLSVLNDVNLDNLASDCMKHPVKHKGHNCSYCSLSAQDIYHRLDDLYQQLHAGKISKDQAMKTAKALYNCYQLSMKRKKDSSYGTKVSRFYNSIANY